MAFHPDLNASEIGSDYDLKTRKSILAEFHVNLAEILLLLSGLSNILADLTHIFAKTHLFLPNNINYHSNLLISEKFSRKKAAIPSG
ncbi:hypothetical protein AAEO50_00020 [Rossellomorea oryzaecorticis]|uniref:Uncharacterized protein n=1 Tax=Rossellomorea oryzaecorticis TaxID=1396505 RepID=A0ABU9K6Q1_9BACI